MSLTETFNFPDGQLNKTSSKNTRSFYYNFYFYLFHIYKSSNKLSINAFKPHIEHVVMREPEKYTL